jgi:hypothetical protein
MNWKSRFFLALLASQSLVSTFLATAPAQGQTLTHPHDLYEVSYADEPQRNTPQANEAVELEFVAPSYRQEGIEDNGFRIPDELLFDDKVGARAIDLFGCDCAGCRYTANRMMQNDMYNVQASQNKWNVGQFQAVRQGSCLRA